MNTSTVTLPLGVKWEADVTFRLPTRCRYDLRSHGWLRSECWYLFCDVSGESVTPVKQWKTVWPLKMVTSNIHCVTTQKTKPREAVVMWVKKGENKNCKQLSGQAWCIQKCAGMLSQPVLQSWYQRHHRYQRHLAFHN